MVTLDKYYTISDAAEDTENSLYIVRKSLTKRIMCKGAIFAYLNDYLSNPELPEEYKQNTIKELERLKEKKQKMHDVASRNIAQYNKRTKLKGDS